MNYLDNLKITLLNKLNLDDDDETVREIFDNLTIMVSYIKKIFHLLDKEAQDILLTYYKEKKSDYPIAFQGIFSELSSTVISNTQVEEDEEEL